VAVREADRTLVTAHVVDADHLLLVDDEPEQAAALGQPADGLD
jgi:hypothetical protein